ncbi:MAG: hypothetical protein RBR59_09625 [Sulfurimonadaceae bacterium]|jgi:hypothetical protein|nr:hypothetical protein [Sulfurimonadaceae bacterium]
MTKSILLDKYPIYSLEIQKIEITQDSMEKIVAYFEEKIAAHPIAKFIALFDHYAHTTSINGEINENIKDAKNIIFCFGAAIPNTKILAARPRSIAVSELENSFMIEFMQAPMDPLQAIMESWVKELVK